MFSANLNAASYFSFTIFRSLLKDYKSLAVTLLTPLFILGMFAYMGRLTGGGNGMYASTVGFALMMVGSVQATRIVNWARNRCLSAVGGYTNIAWRADCRGFGRPDHDGIFARAPHCNPGGDCFWY